MLIGIDVGGTFTDGVLIERGEVVRTAKIPTAGDLLPSLTEVLDEMTQGIDPQTIERVVLSTTLITNLIAEGRTEPVAAVLMPGPGVNPKGLVLPGKKYIISGAVDYRGRELEPVREDEIYGVVSNIEKDGFKKVAVVGKFSPRNHSHEQRVAAAIRKAHPDWVVEVGYEAAGELNFPRRVVNAVMNAATKEAYRFFAQQIKSVLQKRRISAPVFILKADGGTIPVDEALTRPVETIFSGPAASVMGVMALTPPGGDNVVVDIGGTTTDLALLLSGKPLLSSKGVRIKEWRAQVRAFAVKSVPVGGDSEVRWNGDFLQIGPHRAGPAGCLGGDAPTLTDALRVLGLTEIGDLAGAKAVLGRLAAKRGLSLGETAKIIVSRAVEQIASEIDRMFLEWETEPAYRIWELKQKGKIRPQYVAGVGGSAPALVPLIADRLNCRGIVPPYAAVANAVGAAVSRPTLSISLHVDTEQQMYYAAETSAQGKLEKATRFSLEDAVDLAKGMLREEASRSGASEYADEMEVIRSEVFHMVRDWHTVGRLFDVTVQISPGLIGQWGGASYA